jgi:hypothetical protein
MRLAQFRCGTLGATFGIVQGIRGVIESSRPELQDLALKPDVLRFVREQLRVP